HGVDYVALGHLHSPQEITSDGPRIRYSGSPLPYSLSEQDRPKSSTLLTIAEDGSDVELIPAPAPYRLATISATMDEPTSGFDEYRHMWLRVRVTDTGYPDSMYTRIKERFPHAMDIQHAPLVSAHDNTTPQVAP